MMPARSASLPTKKPGTSCKKINGMLNASHRQVKCVALSQPAASIDPAKKYGLLAMKPTDRPPTRPSAVIKDGPYCGRSSKNSPSSVKRGIRMRKVDSQGSNKLGFDNGVERPGVDR